MIVFNFPCFLLTHVLVHSFTCLDLLCTYHFMLRFSFITLHKHFFSFQCHIFLSFLCERHAKSISSNSRSLSASHFVFPFPSQRNNRMIYMLPFHFALMLNPVYILQRLSSLTTQNSVIDLWALLCFLSFTLKEDLE